MAADAELGSWWQTGHLHLETRVAYLSRVDPVERLPAPEREILRSGPTRAPLLDRLTPAWRRRSVVLIAFMSGVVVGGGAAWWFADRSPIEVRAPSPPAAAGADVRLVLSGVVSPRQVKDPHGTVGNDPLRIDAVLLHGRGPGNATVTRIHRVGGSIAIRAPALPVTLSVNHSTERIRLEITARDCGLAAEWTPSAQPFTITWQDDHGDIHTDTAGDHDVSMELALIRYFDVVCGHQATR